MLQSNEIINVLENEESKGFIIRHLNDHLASLMLKYRGKTQINLTLCLQLIGLYRKSKSKLPELTALLPALDERSYQQATSEAVASYKSSLFFGEKLLDLSGGLGIDDIAFSRVFDKVLSVDPNIELNQLARYNFKLLGIDNIKRLDASAEDFSHVGFDWVYIDPDRRDEKRRNYSLESLKPNPLELVPKILSGGLKVALKLSPMFELKELPKVFPEASTYCCISEGNDLKEVLVLFEGNKKEPKVIAAEVGQHAYEFVGTTTDWSVKIAEEFVDYKFLLLPKVALQKSHLVAACFADYGIKKVPQFEIYQSQKRIETNAFRHMEIVWRGKANAKQILQHLKYKQVGKLNIVIKGSSVNSAEWYKKLNVKEGGNLYLILLFGSENRAYLGEIL